MSLMSLVSSAQRIFTVCYMALFSDLIYFAAFIAIRHFRSSSAGYTYACLFEITRHGAAWRRRHHATTPSRFFASYADATTLHARFTAYNTLYCYVSFHIQRQKNIEATI